MDRTSPLLAVLFFLVLVSRAASAGPASLRALVPGADRSTGGLFATPSPIPGYGFLHTCTDCSRNPPLYTPWALLTYLYSPKLDDSLISAVQTNVTAIIIIVDRLAPDTHLASRLVMKYAFNDKHLNRILEIPVITIDRARGDQLAAITRTFGKVPVYISPEESFRDETVFLLLLAISIVLFIVCIFGFQICGEQKRRIPVPTIHCPYQSAVSKIPTQEIMHAQDPVFDDENKCAVCIEGYQVAEVISLLPCHHVFHKDCIEPWLLSKRLCPMCKMDVIKYYGPINLGSEESIVDIPLDEDIIVNNMASVGES